MDLDIIYNEDCLEGMKNIPDKSIDLIVADPPYYKVMLKTWDGIKCNWDNTWKTIDDYLKWVIEWAKECNRVLKDNGSLYIFTDDKISAYVQIEFDKIFSLINNIIWVKPNNMSIKGWNNFNCYAPITEHILFYEKLSSSGLPATGLQEIHNTSECFTTIKDYMRSERDLLMVNKGLKTITEFNDFINNWTNTNSVVSRHYFADSQYSFPTLEIYKRMQETGYWQRPYETLRKEYETLRRPFHPNKNYTDVWKYSITSTNEITIHPTQKPLKLIERIINISTNEGGIILDPFMGSGTTAIACIRNNRHYIGFELDSNYYQKATERINQAQYKEKVKTTLLDY